MDSISPAWLLLAAIVCSMVGRFMLIRAAWEISKPWGIAVLTLPLAPMFFRMNYKELAGEGKHWLTATSIFFILFVGLTGSRGSADDLWSIVPEKLRPAEYAEHRSADNEEIVPEGPKTDEEDEADAEDIASGSGKAHKAHAARASVAPTAAPAAKKGFFGRMATLIRGGSPQPAQPAQPAAGTTAATLAPPLIAGPTLAEQVAANQAEFARLGVVYETLKKERGYLKKWDQDQIKAYNEQAAKYQADLAKARADQVELNKQAALAKK